MSDNLTFDIEAKTTIPLTVKCSGDKEKMGWMRVYWYGEDVTERLPGDVVQDLLDMAMDQACGESG